MDFLQVVENRRSYRKFTEEKIDKDLLEKIVNIAIKSPTAMNKQNRIFTVIQNEDIIKRLEDILASEYEIEDYNFFGAPCMILVSAPKKNEIMGLQDTSIALDHLYLAATYYGLGSCWINQFKEAKSEEYYGLLQEINIPEDHIVYAAMAVGYPDEVPEENPRNEEIRFVL